MKKLLKKIKLKYFLVILSLFLLSTVYAAINVQEKINGTVTINGNPKTVTLKGSNISFSSNTVQVLVGGQTAFQATPSAGYYIYSASCTNGYTLTVSTGIEYYDTQNVVVKNASSTQNSTCTFTTTRITASMLTYSNANTTCTTAQCALDELFQRYN